MDDHDVWKAVYEWLRARRSQNKQSAEQIVSDFRAAPLDAWQIQNPVSLSSNGEQSDDGLSDGSEFEAPTATNRDLACSILANDLS